MKSGELKRRADAISRQSYAKRREGELAIALSAMRLWEARALVLQTREFLTRFPVSPRS